MRTTAWDAIITSAPLNKDAAVARDGRGEAFVPRKNICPDGFLRSQAPFKTKPFPATTPGHSDLTGLKVGRLTVIGFADLPKSKSGGRWVVRCVCGWYEVRHRKALANPAYAARARCSECDYTAEMLAGRNNVQFPKQSTEAFKRQEAKKVSNAA